jgi:K319-like protein
MPAAQHATPRTDPARPNGNAHSTRPAEHDDVYVKDLTTGALTLRLTVTDPSGASSSDEVTVTVNPK